MNTPVFSLPQISQKQSWGQLYGSALPLAITEYCMATSGVKLIITPDNLTATRLYDTLTFFLTNKAENSSTKNIFLFPDWETLPYDQFSPHQDIISERLTTLNRLSSATNMIVISAINTVMHRLCPAEFLHQYSLFLKTGDTLDLTRFREQLVNAGYYAVNQVMTHGEFVVRGAILDLFPMGHSEPVRIELFDDEIESIRFFDPETQRTTKQIHEFSILPAREFPLNDVSISQFRQTFRETFSGNPTKSPIYEAISEKHCPGGIEYYLPLFFAKTATIFDYLPLKTTIFYIENIPEKAEQFWNDANTRYQQRQIDNSRPLLSPDRCFIAPDEFLHAANQLTQIRLSQDPIDKKGVTFNFATQKPLLFPVTRQGGQPLQKLAEHLNVSDKKHLVIVESAGRREVLLNLMQQSGISAKQLDSWPDFLVSPAKINLIVAPLEEGSELDDAKISIITESQIFGEQYTPTRRTQQKGVDPNLIIRDLVELHIGSPVVHLQFGVGRYQGLETIQTNGINNEFLKIVYARDDKIYVPVTSLHMISRYSGADSDHAPLHQLGSDQFAREKKKAEEKIHDVAIELLEIYAKRAAKEGKSAVCPENEYLQFASDFPFSETDDQKSAIEAIRQDMAAPRPMDRLICGDVGFGKTEVAIRAAFIAVQNNQQVCILVPTTLLASQHYETFCNRFANFPVTIDLLSRFKSVKESNQILEKIKNGRIDIIIGTHKLFSEKVEFKQLGLLIIDEEHRFGVKQKEHIKRLRTSVDILSMTATPIPRTLNMAMAGIRDISLITTPPAKRLAIKTFWHEHNETLIREAILREIFRGGQVYYLHNDVKSIQHTADTLKKLVPEAKIEIGHGQMPERALEKVMSDFYHHRFQVLVCTTIIETGIDIPTANTIIIERADKFGLAQLHQLRGRVGRSHHQAYAYLFTPDKKLLTSESMKRLEAIVSLEDLGAGFTLASHDLEIRGAGELLGEEQSGNMQAIGFNLYMDMLEKAVEDLKSGKTPDLAAPYQQGTEIDLHMSAILPDSYIPDVHTRLIMYKRISNAKNQASLETLHVELIDRFGLLPDSAKNLIKMTELKLQAEHMGIKKITASAQQGKLVFDEQPKINLQTLIQLIQVYPKSYQLDGNKALRFTLAHQGGEARITEVKDLLKRLET